MLVAMVIELERKHVAIHLQDRKGTEQDEAESDIDEMYGCCSQI